MALVCAITVAGQSSGTVACDFGFEVVDLPCSILPAAVPQRDLIPNNSNWGRGLLDLVLAGIGFMVVRARH